LEYPSDHKRIIEKKLADLNFREWKKVADNMYFPVSKELGVIFATRRILDKDLVPVKI
jgi:maltose phosphorylase